MTYKKAVKQMTAFLGQIPKLLFDSGFQLFHRIFL